jgi:PAS domain S-box-containing protein
MEYNIQNPKQQADFLDNLLQRQIRLNQLQQALLANGDMGQKLKMITDGVVEIFGAHFCRIWTIGPGDLCEQGCIHAEVTEGPHICRQKDKCLHLISSSGRYTQTDGGHRRVPFGAYKIGRVAAGEEHKFLTNKAMEDPRIHDHTWARELGLTAFAGYQLRPPGGEILGVVALFKRCAIAPEEDAQLDALSGTTAQVISVCLAEKALKESEGKYRRLVETANEGICAMDSNYRTTYVNRHMADMLGYSQGDVLGRPMVDFLFPEDLPDHEIRMAQCRLGLGDHYERRFLRRDGSELWTIVAVRALLDEAGAFQGCFAMLTDITERKLAEEALQRSKEEWEATFDAVPELIMILDENHRVRKVNRAMAEVVLSNPESLISKHCYEVVHHTNAPPHFCPHVRTLADGLMHTTEVQELGLDLLVTTSPLTDKHGRTIGSVHMARDITERKRAEEEKSRLQDQLAQAQKMEALGTLAGGIAHDFNNILWAIMGFTELTLYSFPEGSKERWNLQKVLQASERARDLVTQILAFSRHAVQEKKPLKIAFIVQEALKLLRATIPTTIEITQTISAPEALILADPTQVHQIIMNLCTNAAQALREKGNTLRIGLEEEYFAQGVAVDHRELASGPYVKLTVSDNGPGIAPEVIDKIFDPFFTTKGVGEGTGMGLAAVYGIVKSYGGTITVSSRLGEGATFTVFLPKIVSREPEEQEAQTSIPKGCGHILVIDDEEILVAMNRNLLEGLGYEVTTANGSLEALGIFQAQPDKFDLVITDQTMPHMDGLQLSWEFRQIRPNIPIIICTGFNEKVSQETVEAAGIDALLMKPVNLRNLGETVKKVTAK